MSRVDTKAQFIARACELCADAGEQAAAGYLATNYPFTPQVAVKRRYGPKEMTKRFVRDGFIDRYSGDRLLFPPVLRMLSLRLGEAFPFSPAWKTDVMHSAYWEVGATLDHVRPVTLGGADSESNWVTTSMARNFVKQNWTLEDLGWTLVDPGDIRQWDGQLRWFLSMAERHPETVRTGNLRIWHQAAIAARPTLRTESGDR